MPVSFNSPARNFFLLGSSGEQVVTNFFKTIDQSSGTDGVYIPDEIRYNSSDQKFVLAGSASDSNSKGFGWFEKRDNAGTADWDVRVEATSAGVNTTLRAMELDSSSNLIVVGKTGNVPWIAKYSNGGVIDWQSTTNSGDVEYTGVTSDSNGQYYACGNTPSSGEAQAFVEKFDANGNPGWGKSAFMLGRDVVITKIDANNRGEVVAVGYLEDDSRNKGYVIKIDTDTGEVLWDRTIASNRKESTNDYDDLFCQGVYIDSKNQIYVVGKITTPITEINRGFIIKYTAEGNMIWQKETPVDEDIEYYEVKSDGETEQTIVFGRYYDSTQNDQGGLLSKYSKNGSLVWRRGLFSSYNNLNYFESVSLDADPSFYYLLYTDDTINELSGTPASYTFGKVSSSGNGLGDFEYAEGTGETVYYEIINIQDNIGRLSDGSVRQDTSDLITYPFTANKLLFDDLATQVSNKKRQMDGPDSFEYSGSPAIRPADFQELNLLGSVYSGSGDWLDQSGKGNDSNTSTGEPFYDAGAIKLTNASTDYYSIPYSSDFDLGTEWTIEFFLFPITNRASKLIGTRGDSSPRGWEIVYWNSAIGIEQYGDQSTAGQQRTTQTISANGLWTHVAVVNSGGEVKIYYDGVDTGFSWTGSSGSGWGAGSHSLRIGKPESYNEGPNVLMSNIRITKSAVYSANFIPPKSALSTLPNTVLLTAQGTVMSDASDSNHSITAGGGASISNTFLRPTHNSAGYWEFDGVDDCIRVPGDSINFTSSDSYSVEFWVYINSTQPDTGNGDNDILEKWTASDGYPFVFRYIRASGTINAVVYGPPTSASASLNINTDTWNHVCGVFDRTTNQLSLYVNYTSSTTTSIASVTGDTTNDSDLFIMKRGGNINHAAGRFGELRIYPRALTTAQVFQNYNATREKYTGVPASTDPGLTSTRTPA